MKRRLALVLLLAAIIEFGGFHVALASGRPAWIRILNAWPGVEVDSVLLGESKVADKLLFAEATKYASMAPGKALASFRTVNHRTITIPVEVASGMSYTTVLFGPTSSVLLVDDFRPAGTGRSGIRFLNMSPDVPASDLLLGEAILGKGIEFGTAGGYTSVEAGRITVGARRNGDSAAFASLTFHGEPGGLYSVLLVGSGEEPARLAAILDAMGPATIPQGSVPTGSRRNSYWTSLAFLGAAIGLLAVALTRRKSFAFLCVVVGLALAACGPSRKAERIADSDSAPVAQVTHRPQQEPTSWEPTPVDLAIPAYGITGRVVPLDTSEGAAGGQLLQLGSPSEIGWYVHSSVPGEPGLAVLVGHVNFKGQAGVFQRLPEVFPGTSIEITLSDGRAVTFRSSHGDSYRKDAFPTVEVYRPVPVAAIRLITCTGPVSAGRYRDNFVLSAYIETDDR